MVPSNFQILEIRRFVSNRENVSRIIPVRFSADNESALKYQIVIRFHSCLPKENKIDIFKSPFMRNTPSN